MRTGTCKFGVSCKFHHPKQGIGSAIPVALNYYGSAVYPAAQSPAVHSSQQYGVVVARSPVLSSYGPYGSVLLSPSMVPYHGRSPYPVGE